MYQPELIDTATVYPHLCPCGSANGPFLLTGLETHSGALMLCQACLVRIVGAVEAVPKATYEKHLAQANETARSREQLDADLMKAHREIDAQAKKIASLSTKVETLTGERDISRDQVIQFDAELKTWRNGTAGRREAAMAAVLAASAKPPEPRAGGSG